MKRFVVVILLVALSAAGGMVWYSSAQSKSEGRSFETFESDHFSVDLPTELRAVTPALEGGQNMVVFENSDGTAGFQVFILVTFRRSTVQLEVDPASFLFPCLFRIFGVFRGYLESENHRIHGKHGISRNIHSE